MPKMPDVYTADMGNPPVEQDAGILARGKRGMPPPAAMPRRRPASMPTRPDPADAGIFTADKGIQPPMDDDMGSAMPPVRPTGERQKKAAKDIRSAMGMKKGGSVKSSASKRADGCATKGKTKGRFV